MDLWTELNLENEDNFNEFNEVLDSVKDDVSSIIIHRYREYLKGKLGSEFPPEIVRDNLHNFFEGYKLTEMI
jgi:hypothetical protein